MAGLGAARAAPVAARLRAAGSQPIAERARRVAALLGFIARWPELDVVIDHAAKPTLGEGWQADWVPTWRAGMRDIASHPHVHCKFSALLTEADAAAVGDVEAAVATVRPVWD